MKNIKISLILIILKFLLIKIQMADQNLGVGPSVTQPDLINIIKDNPAMFNGNQPTPNLDFSHAVAPQNQNYPQLSGSLAGNSLDSLSGSLTAQQNLNLGGGTNLGLSAGVYVQNGNPTITGYGANLNHNLGNGFSMNGGVQFNPNLNPTGGQIGFNYRYRF